MHTPSTLSSSIRINIRAPEKWEEDGDSETTLTPDISDSLYPLSKQNHSTLCSQKPTKRYLLRSYRYLHMNCERLRVIRRQKVSNICRMEVAKSAVVSSYFYLITSIMTKKSLPSAVDENTTPPLIFLWGSEKSVLDPTSQCGQSALLQQHWHRCVSATGTAESEGKPINRLLFLLVWIRAGPFCRADSTDPC